MSALIREIRGGFKGPVTHKFVLHTIATYADRTGLAWPSQERLAIDVGITERQLRRIVDKLEESGWLKIELRGDGRGNSTHYRLAKPVKAELSFPLFDAPKAEPGVRLSERSKAIKADIQGTERRTPVTVKADIAMSAEESEESEEGCRGAYAPAPKFVRTRKSRPRKRTAETPWPADFMLTPARRKVATNHDLDPDLQFQLCRSKAIEKNWRSANWDEKWNQWVLHEVQFAAARAKRNGSSRSALPPRKDVEGDEYTRQMKGDK